ncbi:MAG: SpoVG family protein, partial [Acidimicrobiia bacterium]|nr:SpoVG family protein [Acidimicrobiia bacterium]
TPVLLIVMLAAGACSDDPLMHADDAEPGSIGNLVGGYVLNGIDPYGKEYTGRLDITGGPVSHEYELHWIVTEAFQEGTGTLNGNVLEIEWETSDQAALAVAGTARFTVTVDGELHGVKMVTGTDDEWRETAYPINADDI